MTWHLSVAAASGKMGTKITRQVDLTVGNGDLSPLQQEQSNSKIALESLHEKADVSQRFKIDGS
jgi:hypothetical protein